jgi:hypothetical protein
MLLIMILSFGPVSPVRKIMSMIRIMSRKMERRARLLEPRE